MSRNETFKFQFFSLQICCHFQSKMSLGTLLGFPFKMADKVTYLKLTCYRFLKTLDIRQNLHSRVIQILFTGMYYLLFHYSCWTALVYKFHFATKRGQGWNSIDQQSPEDICHFNDRTFHSDLSRIYLVRSAAPLNLVAEYGQPFN